jgi:hypothetical protein
MLTEGAKDVNFFVITQIVFTCIFAGLFYIFGIQTETSDGYNRLSLWGLFLQTFREGLGDFGNVDGEDIAT